MLFSQIVYGPVHSRRLGISLGINLLPTDNKLCTFNCVYCECGWNTPVTHPKFPSREEVQKALREKLIQMKAEKMPLDAITFSGNGEPTIHPAFADIIKDTCSLRDELYPNTQISVLSNSTQLWRKEVIDALLMCDNRILKLDSAIDHTMRLIDQPASENLSVKDIVRQLDIFKGDFTLQTCFLTGEYNGEPIDNTTETETKAWYNIIQRLHPKCVMMYVIDRTTPCRTLAKVPFEKLESIAEPIRQMGIEVIISA